jgi:hypothetical protein
MGHPPIVPTLGKLRQDSKFEATLGLHSERLSQKSQKGRKEGKEGGREERREGGWEEGIVVLNTVYCTYVLRNIKQKSS